MHWAEEKGEASKAMSLMLVSIGMLEKDGGANAKDVKGDWNTILYASQANNKIRL